MNTAESRLEKTVFLVEATHYERLAIWREVAHNAPKPEISPPIKWEQMDGWRVTVGHYNKQPICVEVSWVKMDGYLVCFWEATSMLVDYAKVNAWFETHFKGRWDNNTRSATCDAMNFGHCISALRELKQKAKEA